MQISTQFPAQSPTQNPSHLPASHPDDHHDVDPSIDDDFLSPEILESLAVLEDERILREKVMRGLANIAAGRFMYGEAVEAECDALFTAEERVE